MELGLKLRQFGFRIHAFRSAQVFFPSVHFPVYSPYYPRQNDEPNPLKLGSLPLYLANVGEFCGPREDRVSLISLKRRTDLSHLYLISTALKEARMIYIYFFYFPYPSPFKGKKKSLSSTEE